MAIVGKVLKSTTRVGYNYGVKRKNHNPEQSKVLLELLNKAKQTKFGKDNNFSKILNSEDVCGAFRDEVSLYTYDSFYAPYIKDQLEGSKNISWPNKINFFALSSGTTNDASKRIPVSDQMIKQFQKTTLEQVLHLHELNLPSKFFESAVLTIGGSTKLVNKETYFEGDLSGILQKNKSFVFRLFSKPGKRIAQIKDWNEKLDEMVKNAPKWDVGVLAGAPSWILMLIERIVKKYKLTSIHEMWPNFRLFLHGGVFLDTYKDKIESFCSKPIYFQNTYLASEGYFAYQKNPEDEGMSLLTNHGIYYEFIEEKYFDIINNQSDISNIPTCLLNEVKEGANYALVISTTSGLWRYFMGDVIKFTNLSKLQLQITGRVKHTLSVMGEHLSVDNMNKAVKLTTDYFGISAEEYCVVADKVNNCHNWFIGANKEVDNVAFAKKLDQALVELNDDYEYVRKYLLSAPKIKILPCERFYEFMETKNKLGGQHKFPRVLNGNQACEWDAFLSRLD